MASELHDATCYKLSISVDQTLDARLPPRYAVYGDRFLDVYLIYKHVVSNSNDSDLPPQQLYTFSRNYLYYNHKFFNAGPEVIGNLLYAGVGLQYLPGDDAVAGFVPVISRFAASVVALDWMAVVPVRMSVTADTLITLPKDFYRARRFYSKDIIRSSSVGEALKVATADEAHGRCSICLEDFVVLDCRAVKMPCSHVYHQECIVQWLMKSCMCPLCRQALPS